MEFKDILQADNSTGGKLLQYQHYRWKLNNFIGGGAGGDIFNDKFAAHFQFSYNFFHWFG